MALGNLLYIQPELYLYFYSQKRVLIMAKYYTYLYISLIKENIFLPRYLSKDILTFWCSSQ